ncbi:DNA polymerase III subunit gamma/tau [Thiospirochaeta perfilievii]|uniref:DNA polymerase III subunit gamma/tau n=1 Tax=Thiospirochaeta perfilievii TaxID=252967 RepID=A0A5C1QEZ2_9SPIO|nr:DNA polymerase III subunit gamma/tau [Thiospirochaeta perfilievii]QEN04792.1 DNA polymerase III subunit gamma/tau [Thiospirochaeta perfilievii]
MAYEVTANRRRPQVFQDLAGQEFVVSTLTSAIKSKRIAHAYLFSGPRGVGKTSSARILAKSLNCKEGPTDLPCGKCNNCREITTGSSMDVIEIDGASNTSVNDIREIKDEVLFAPNGSKYKIYIIDEVHMLSNSAFNALLKTIEEPPEYIIFIFATTEIHKVPATIRSRCQQFNFRLIPTETLKELLVEACTDMNIKYNDDALFWIAKEGNGSSRDAYTLYDQIVSFSENDITLEKIREKLGLVGLDNMNDLVESMAKKDPTEVLNKCDYILKSGVAVEQFIVDLAEYFRNLLFLNYGINKESLLGCSSDRFSKISVDSFSVIQLEHAVDLILKLYKDIRYSVNPRFELELLLSRLSTLTDYISNDEILDKIKILKESISGGSFTTEQKVKPKIDNLEKKKTINIDPQQIETSNPAEQFFNKFKTGHKKSQSGKQDRVESPRVESPRVESPRVESEDSFNISKGEKVSIETIKKSVFRKLRGSSITLASTLEKAERWELVDSNIYLTYKNPFEAALVEKEKSKVLSYIKEIDNTIKSISINKSEIKDININIHENDEQIDKILTMFRGSIV